MRSNSYPRDLIAAQARLHGRALSEAWGTFLGRVPWQLFVTLTFDPIQWPSVDKQLAMKEAIWWCQQTSRLVRRPLAWALAAERGRGGRWHAHVLLVGLPDGLGGGPEAMWRQRNGHLDVKEVWRSDRLSVYATKQAALEGDVELSDTLRRYRDVLTAGPSVDLYPVVVPI